uniref:Uncharacterized protein n=1 Tax=Arundo donax TaxID=35708 RepID=A0A0A9B6X0_ARUDO
MFGLLVVACDWFFCKLSDDILELFRADIALAICCNHRNRSTAPAYLVASAGDW